MSSISIKEYFALAGSKFSNDDARAIGPVLQDLASVGDVTPAAVVHAAHSSNSPLHAYFEWNDKVAAGHYRESQAQEMIQSVRVRFTAHDKEYSTRAYQVVTRPQNTLPEETVVTNVVTHPLEQVAQALRELDAWRIKHSHLQSMRRLDEIVVPLCNQISEFKEDFPTGPVPPELKEALNALIGWKAQFDGTFPAAHVVGEHMAYMAEAIDAAWSKYCAVKADRFAKDKILERENEELHERIAQLEGMLGQTWLPPIFGLTSKEEQVVQSLLSSDVMTSERAMLALYSDNPDDPPDEKIIDVFVCKIRKKLEPFGVEIKTHWGRGWSMSTESKNEIRALIEARRAA